MLRYASYADTDAAAADAAHCSASAMICCHDDAAVAMMRC